MELFFINLASQEARRKALEASIAASDAAHWPLHRVEAVTALEAEGAGSLRPAERACFLSHSKAIRQSLRHEGHALILEDDVAFGKSSAAVIDRHLANIPEDSWDLIFPDATIPLLDTMYQLFQMRQQYDRSGQDGLIDLASIKFAGAMSYIVNRRAKEKLLQLVEGPLDLSYDLMLLNRVHARQLRAFLIFPFAVTQASTEGPSLVQPDSQGMINSAWRGFRQLVWRERDIAQAVVSLDGTEADPDCAAMGRIFALMVTLGRNDPRP